MVRNRFSIKKLGLVISDLLIVILSYCITMMFRLGVPIPKENFDAFLMAAPWILFFSLVVFFLCDLYNNWIYDDRLKVVVLLLTAVVLSTLLTMGINYLTHNLALPRTVTVINMAVEWGLLSASRLFIWSWYQKNDKKKRAICIGRTEEEANAVEKDFWTHEPLKYVFCGAISVTNAAQLNSLLKEKNIDVVAMRAPIAGQADIFNLCIQENKEILIVPDIMTILLHHTVPETIDDKLVLSFKPFAISPVYKTIKRIFDVTISSFLLIALFPLMLIIAGIIYLTSPGHAFFRQERLGEQGEPFQLLKFRSMVSNAEEETGPVLAAVDDPRITKFGKLLRNSRLDELPQLINVLKGDMSLIGPRPEREFFVKEFLETIPFYSYRMAVKPGLTGLAQVMGRYNTSPEDKLRFDLIYISSNSFLLDLKILFLTAKIVFHLERADGVKIDYNEASRRVAS